MNKILFSIAGMSVLLFSCSKVKSTIDNNTNNQTTTPAAPQPNITNADGSLVALETKTSSMVMGVPIDLSIGTGVAVLGNLAGQSYVDVGTVTLNSSNLTKQSNNSYVFTPTVSNPTGIDVSGNIAWTVSGGNGFNGFSVNATKGMPVMGSLNGSYAQIDRNSICNLQVTSISNADSVYFQLAGPNGTVLKRAGNNTTSMSFSVAEVQSVGTGNGSVVVAAWNMQSSPQGGKSIYLINESALASVVEFK